MGDFSMGARSGSGSDTVPSAERALSTSLSDRRILGCYVTGVRIEICIGSLFWGCGNTVGNNHDRLADRDPGKHLAHLAMDNASQPANGRTAREPGRGGGMQFLAVSGRKAAPQWRL